MSKEEIEILDKETITFNHNVEIQKWLFPKNNFEYHIYLKSGVVFTSCLSLELENISGTIYIHSLKNSVCKLNLGIKFQKNNNLSIINIQSEDNVLSNIKIKVMQADTGTTLLKTLGIIEENTHNNEFLEEIKVLNISDIQITCLPELIVKSDDVIANHNVTVRHISEEELFYLESKGLSEREAKKLIIEGFIKV